MPGILKYLFGLCCALVLTYTGAGAAEKGFDIIDATTGHAVIKQSQHNDVNHFNTANQHKKESSLLTNHRQNKKYRGGKHISFGFYCKFPENNHMDIPYSNLVFTPKIPKHYRYLFCKEINPPPPKSC